MSSQQFSIAIIGAGNAGLEMLNQLTNASFVNIIAVVDRNAQAPGMLLAKEKGIATTDDFTNLFKDGEELDIIIDVTGIQAVREQLREYMQVSNNNHTVIMHERISALLVSLFNGKLVTMKDSDGVY
jgi:predicted homoserine dehydrogenase-like protein